MTDSVKEHDVVAAARGQGKRERLIAAAAQLVYQQGVEKTTIADIAQAADVPVGNVYYYFKTKDEIIGAVIETHVRSIQAQIAELERAHRTPKARLKALVGLLTGQSDMIAELGCPHGTLCSELDKRPARPGDRAVAQLLRVPIEWTEHQFTAMGREDARDLAVRLIAAYEGMALLASTFRDPSLLASEGRRLGQWIDSLEPDQ
jgi:TetR/AcrR family transcriptional regulator, transcriptional repressor for nem operon